MASGRAPWLVQDGRPTPPVRTPDLLQTQVGANRLARVVKKFPPTICQNTEIGCVVMCWVSSRRVASVTRKVHKRAAVREGEPCGAKPFAHNVTILLPIPHFCSHYTLVTGWVAGSTRH